MCYMLCLSLHFVYNYISLNSFIVYWSCVAFSCIIIHVSYICVIIMFRLYVMCSMVCGLFSFFYNFIIFLFKYMFMCCIICVLYYLLRLHSLLFYYIYVYFMCLYFFIILCVIVLI